MRLGQAARTFETTTDKLVKLLADNFREVNDHPNIKLTDEEFAFFETQFKPAEQIIEEDADSMIPKEEEALIIASETESSHVDAPEFVESLRPQVFSLEQDFTEKTKEFENFKAEKPELEGLKVLGKIELPEPKPKVDKKEDESASPRPERTRKRNPRGQRKNKQGLSPEEERARERRLALRKKHEEEERAKELKKKHYEENVKAKLQAAPIKKKKKRVENKPRSSQHKVVIQNGTQKPQKAKGLKRFWLWLNGAYDQHD